MSEIVISEWYEGLKDELEAALIETRKQLGDFVIHQKYILGEIIDRNFKLAPDDTGITEVVDTLAKDLECSDRLLWHSKEFFELVGPRPVEVWLLEQPQDKVRNWTAIRTNFLTNGEEITRGPNPKKIAEGIVNRHGLTLAEKIRDELSIILD
jgi:hypothetical protein